MTNEKLNTGDVFRSFLVENADYDGDFELPKIKTSSAYPRKTLSFMAVRLTAFSSRIRIWE